MTRLLALGAALVLLSAGTPASARIRASVTPDTFTATVVSANGHVTWTATSMEAPAPPPNLVGPLQVRRAITSPGARFVTDTGRVLTLGQAGPLRGSAEALAPAAASRTATFSEAVRVPPDLMRRAQQLGARRVLYVRDFVERIELSGTVLGLNTLEPFRQVVTGRGSAAVAFYPTTGLGGPFMASRIALRFDDGAVARVVEERADLAVWADVTYAGTGELVAVWEIAEAAGTLGTPMFRPLRQVRRFLGAGQRTSFRGPTLPTREPGPYIVRFRVQAPEEGVDGSQIHYWVLEPVQRARVRATSPAPESGLAPDTRFAWGDVPGAGAWEVVFYADDQLVSAETRPPLFEPDQPRFRDVRGEGGLEDPFEVDEAARRRHAEPSLVDGARPVATLLVAGPQRETTLPALTRSHLRPGRTYAWQVRAYRSDGARLAESPLRRLIVPVSSP